jgi:hypothetical protein
MPKPEWVLPLLALSFPGFRFGMTDRAERQHTLELRTRGEPGRPRLLAKESENGYVFRSGAPRRGGASGR